ncbi:MAG: DsbA family protein [Cellvibrionaceae bacterium]|nr:DsbA family protein [Cellvibrionaceae bacterium]
MNALTSDKKLIVYIDIKSPYAFLALKDTLALEQDLNLEFDWRPLTLDIESYLGSAKKSSGKVVESNRSELQWIMVKYAYMDARRYAQRQGHILKGTEKIWDSRLANIAIQWVSLYHRAHLEDFLNEVFTKFWRRELDIEDPKVIENCIELIGLNPDGFKHYSENEGREQHDQLQQELHPAGLFGVPSYVIDGITFFGREHLPVIRWMLLGKQGPAPQISYAL